MLIDPAYAQAAAPAGGQDFLVSMLPLVAIIAIFYFLFIRPQQRRARQHQDMIKNLRRGDTVVTSGGLVGRIAKVVDDHEVELQIAEGVRVRLMRQMVSEVRTKGEPAKEGA
jgi:preprotein translocase subunit YajC